MRAQSGGMARRFVLPVVAVSAVVALAGCGGEAAAGNASPAGHTLTVEFTLTVSDSGGSCEGGQGGYSDIDPTTAVTVYDAAGKVVGAAPLGTDCLDTFGDTADPSTAAWTTKVPGIPDSKFYQVEVGHRGKLTFSRAQLAGADWTAQTSLGQTVQ